MPARFLPLADVAEILAISSAQAYALVRSGELPAIKVGGRGQWRVETSELEDYIQRMYSQTRALVDRGGLEAAPEVEAGGDGLRAGPG
ncbi:helix-turn-helix domain-containing protein [Pseudokineococcus sp. 1T1Z-3]|uniref:helix-turn-helix domain-containing protein n=1 Tax=Pseudokineococcus sp. 1T1Z-3 TaxID=3132745 RepID=UPI0030AF467A